MEFWGIEVKPGQTVQSEPGEEKVLHLSQASLGESKKEKGSENVPIFVKVNNQKLVLGTLSTEKCAQIQYDLVFEKEFELSHGSKNTSVFFVGYKSKYQGYESEDDFSDFDSEDEHKIVKKAKDLVNPAKIETAVKSTSAEKEASGKGENVATAAIAKPKSKAEKVKVVHIKEVEKKLKGKEDDEDDSDSDSDDSEEDSDEDEKMVGLRGDSSSSEDEDDSSEEEGTPKKVKSAPKRKADSASKTSTEKKPKLITQTIITKKTGGDVKKSGHIATPYPSKQGGKPPKSPKSDGGGSNIACKPCGRTFNTDAGLQAHNKAKHSTDAK